MVMFMAWMTGSYLNIFTIIMTFTQLIAPVKAIGNMGKGGESVVIFIVFKAYEGKGIGLLVYKLQFIFLQMCALSVMLYKFYNLGLIPLNCADYVDLIPRQTVPLRT